MIDRLAAALADRYRIVREIGAGGMATVYLAEDLKHGREVALKVLRPELAATMGPERFFREIQVAARLQHPHILPLHDSGEADGFLFFVMPYVIGESLRERLSRLGELPIPDVVRILSQVADALSYSHSQGVVHRDIKPDNVMLSGRHALVTDFGVAKAVSEASGRDGLTTAGVALGTPTYMAPEQATADPMLDHRVDIYALGVLGYEMLTARTPFEGLPPQQMLVAHVTETPRPLRQYRDACPPELEAVVMRCLAKRPADRWQSADELLAALEPLGASSGGVTPTQSRPTSAQQAVTSAAPATRRPWALAAVIVGAAAIGIGGWAVTRDAPQPEDIPYGSFVERQVTTTGLVGPAALSPDQRQVAYAERECTEDAGCTLNLKVQDVEGAGLATVATGATWVANISWSSDGRWLLLNATFNQRFGVYALPSLGGTLRFLGCCLAYPTARGDTAVLSSAGALDDPPTHLYYVTLRDGRTVDSVAVAKESGGLYVGAEMSADRLIAVSPRDGKLFLVVQDRQGTLLDSITTGITGAFDLGFTPTPNGVWVTTPDSTRDDRVTLVHHSISAAGRIARVPDRRIVGVPLGSDANLDPVSGSLTVSYGPLESSLWTARRSSRDALNFPMELVARSTTRLSGSISNDGRYLVLMRNRPADARTWDLSLRPFEGGAERPLGAFENLADWDFFPDNRRILTLSEAGAQTRVEILDIQTGTRQVLGNEPGQLNMSQTLPNNDGWLAIRGLGEALVLRRSGIRSDTSFAPPPGMFNLLQARPTPEGTGAIIAGWNNASDSVIVGRLAFANGAFTRLGGFPSEGVAGLSLMPNGDILLQLWESSASHWFELWQQRTATWRRLGSGPRQDATYRFADDGIRTVVRETVRRADVFVVESPLLKETP